jgi:hypothetical protein
MYTFEPPILYPEDALRGAYFLRSAPKKFSLIVLHTRCMVPLGLFLRSRLLQPLGAFLGRSSDDFSNINAIGTKPRLVRADLPIPHRDLVHGHF